jgi:hypothetical protein
MATDIYIVIVMLYQQKCWSDYYNTRFMFHQLPTATLKLNYAFTIIYTFPLIFHSWPVI